MEQLESIGAILFGVVIMACLKYWQISKRATGEDQKEGDDKPTRTLSPRQKRITDIFLICAVLYVVGLHLTIYGLNYTDVDNRIAAARAYNADPAVRFQANIIQIIENPFEDTTIICGAWKKPGPISPPHHPPCIEYTTRGGHIYGWGRYLA